MFKRLLLLINTNVTSNLAIGIKAQMVNKLGLVFQCAASHEFLTAFQKGCFGLDHKFTRNLKAKVLNTGKNKSVVLPD